MRDRLLILALASLGFALGPSQAPKRPPWAAELPAWADSAYMDRADWAAMCDRVFNEAGFRECVRHYPADAWPWAQTPAHRLYHNETVEQLAAGTVPWPYVETMGRVRLVRMEADGDLHIKLTGVTAFVVLECIEEIPCAKPALNQRIVARGIPRWDGEHKWAELHPLLSWEPVP